MGRSTRITSLRTFRTSPVPGDAEGDQDELWGGAGDDELYGGSEDDILHGGDDDELYGGDGDDVLCGDDETLIGNDYLDGGPDADTLWGVYQNSCQTGGGCVGAQNQGPGTAADNCDSFSVGTYPYGSTCNPIDWAPFACLY